MFLKKSLIILLIPISIYSCQEEIVQIQPSVENSPSVSSSNIKPSANVSQTKSPSPTPIPIPSLQTEEQPKDGEVNDLDKNDNEVVGVDREAIKTNVNWKEFNPIVKGKKYTYNYTIKEGVSVLQTETVWEIISVNDKNYVIRQGFNTSGENKLRTTDIPITLNNDYSPPIIPPIAIGGEKLTDIKNIQITEKTEKLKVPFKEVDAIKVVSDNVTSWYGKDIGLVKSIILNSQGTYTLELKDFK